MAVGFPAKTNFATGDVLTATNMNDVTGTLNLLQSAQFAAGKNAIINGAFNVWQRGTSFSNPATTSYVADRFMVEHDGSSATRTISQQTFTPGTAPVAGYEGTYYLQYAVSGGTSNTYQQVQQRVEDVRTFAGQTVTFSFWAKGDAVRTIEVLNNRNFGSGGSTADQSSVGTVSISTSWARYSVTATMGTVTGKTIGAGSYCSWIMRFAAATAQTIQIWGVQLEAASSASNFQTASGTVQGELALCQRYFQYLSGNSSNYFASAYARTTTRFDAYVPLIVSMRTAPSVSATGQLVFETGASGSITSSSVNLNSATTTGVALYMVCTGTTNGYGGIVLFSTSASLSISAEL
jgi:hypothetical protein